MTPAEQAKFETYDDPRVAKWWRGIGPGRIVYFSTPHGNIQHGPVVIASKTHVTVSIGGRHGTPRVVNESNFMSVKDAPKKRTKK